METKKDQPVSNQDDKKNVLDKRLDSIGWALFLLMIGGLLLMPKGKLPEGTWLIGTGIIIIGLTIVRYFYHLKISTFWVILGIIALIIGITDTVGVSLPVFPILLIIIGASIIFKMLFRKR